jgi:hypothetical protein
MGHRVSVDQSSSRDFLVAVLGGKPRFHFNSTETSHFVNRAAYDPATTSLLVQAIHGGFAEHVSISLNPVTLWYCIVHEVAECIRQNPGQYAGMFTDTPDQRPTIVVRDDSLRYDEPSNWTRSINLIRKPLADRLTTETMKLFLPRFSTSTIVDETALLVALMDAVSPYYKYEWQTLCGIPQIRLEGTVADWQKLHDRADSLLEHFPELQLYRGQLLPVLHTISRIVGGIDESGDIDFWRSVYKYDGGSGGPYVNGWITAFFAYVLTDNGPTLKTDKSVIWKSKHGFYTCDFPSHIGRVPFVWDYFGRMINMAFLTGVTSVDYDGTFLDPKLGFAVVEA